MAKSRQASFRRILLLRILLLSVPILLIGEIVTFNKTRSSMLETASWNLTQSAVRKGESISDAIAAMKASLLMASQTSILQEGNSKQAQKFLEQLAAQMPTHISCAQLTDLETNQVIASTCGNNHLSSYRKYYYSWERAEKQLLPDPNQIYVKPLLTSSIGKTATSSLEGQLQLLLCAPVYNSAGKLRYALSVQSALHQQERDRPGLLAGSTVVIDQNGTILAHPTAESIGQNIQQQTDAQELKNIVNNAIAGRKDFLYLSFKNNGEELVAGYSVIASPLTTEAGQYWVVLALTRLDNALYGLKAIKLILIILIICLVGASLLATLYMARDLARPLEKLRDYALNLQSYHEAERVPHNFQISEVEQLAEALDDMVERLKASAAEIQSAWQEAQTSNKLKSEFLATTSHELRTPLNGIIGSVRIVRDGYCDSREEEMEYLQQADDAANHLLGIINDLLDIAKIEAGKLSVVMEPIDLRQILQEVISLQTIQIAQKKLHLITSNLSEPIMVLADSAKLKQVVINVIGNAVKFTPQGSITIKTHSESATNNGKSDYRTSKVVVTVQDTGVGIDPAQQHKLFRPFVMVDGTTTRQFGGTGLGLAISRKLMQLMNGSIELSSGGIGQGTTVAIALPLLNPSPLAARNLEPEDGTVSQVTKLMLDGKLR